MQNKTLKNMQRDNLAYSRLEYVYATNEWHYFNFFVQSFVIQKDIMHSTIDEKYRSVFCARVYFF